jgi:hypothetical protein
MPAFAAFDFLELRFFPAKGFLALADAALSPPLARALYSMAISANSGHECNPSGTLFVPRYGRCFTLILVLILSGIKAPLGSCRGLRARGRSTRQ